MVKQIPNKSITIAQLEDMFNNISAKTDLDMNGPMLWGYFFTHHEKNKLEQAKIQLEDQGYRYVDIFLADKDETTEPDLWFLHVEKIETHSPESLDKRNDEFYIFAEKFGLDSYDGMDVGPVKQ